jgi:3-deoxy-D-manno-oct-2-ulosonic acid (Kdo) hydroxylase
LSRIVAVRHGSWTDQAPADVIETAAAALERGSVLFLPHLPFIVEADEQAIFSPAILSSSKNTSFDPASGRVRGSTLEGAELDRLRRVIGRFSAATASLIEHLLPRYHPHAQRMRASFRPAEVAGRQLSWRKDDTRLHVDSFPASPVQGRRILRVFSNVNPAGRPRSWRLGSEFEAVAARFAAALSVPWPACARVLYVLGVTKSRRTPYDALMLQLHDRMKRDMDFQERSEQEAIDFASGCTWLTFTDQVSHAATAGQYQLEQTFLVPIEAMIDEHRSPLRILERLKGCRLV